ncbi:MAG TPA: M28 family peptidase, partial [Solirubrobacteraceae bacterium]|nr:M28 family peptidase [Solirubrobacteraceae bacterium]
GWLAWLSLTMIWALAVAVVRATQNHPPHSLGAIQLPPTVALVLALALLLEAAAATYGPAANDNATGTAVAIALANALKAGAPHNLSVELVLQGAGEGQEIGLRRYLRGRRRELGPANAVVLGIAPCGCGHVGPGSGRHIRHWLSDGRLIPLRYSRTLRELCADLEGSAGHRGRGATPALPARAKGLPAIAIGCLDRHGLAPRSHQPTDVASAIDQADLDQAIEFALRLVDAIDGALEPEPANSATPA